MSDDPEIAMWRTQWQSRDHIPAELKNRVEREIRRGRRGWIAPTAVTVLIGGSTLVGAVLSGERAAIQLAALTWIFIAVTWVTSLALLKGVGHRRVPEAATTAAFLDYTIRVCRGKRAGIVAAAALYALFFPIMLVWRYQTGPFELVGDYLLSARVVVMLIVTTVLAVLGVRWYRKLCRELLNLRMIQRRLDGGDGDVDGDGDGDTRA